MSREIKFRAWDTIDRAMREVSAIDWEMGDCRMLPGEEVGDVEQGLDTVKLMQYTGLKDKAGREIYEGDIVAIRTHNPHLWRDGSMKEELAKVIYVPERIAFEYEIISTKFPSASEDNNVSSIKVVGNRFEQEGDE